MTDRAPTGEQLHAEILSHLEATGTAAEDFEALLGPATTIRSIGLTAKPGRATVERVRSAIAQAKPEALPADPTGDQLHAEIMAYLKRSGRTVADFQRQLGQPRLVDQLAVALRPKRGTVDRVRAAIRGEEVEPLPAKPRHGRKAMVAAQERQAAQPATAEPLAPKVPTIAAPSPARQVIEAAAEAVISGPGKAIGEVRERWPQLWRGIVERSREEEMLPGEMMAVLIERGLQVGLDA